MQSATDRQAINHYLQKHGLGQLGDPGLAAALGFLIEDDAELSRLLNVCEPEDRRSMYDALTPNLRFKARPLDEYVSEWREQAEVRQLPVVNEDGTMRAYNVPEIHAALRDYKPPELNTEQIAILQRAIMLKLAEAVAKCHLIVTCKRCMRQETFPGLTKYEAVRAAREASWIYCHGEQSDGWELCPDCGNDLYPKGA